MTDEKCFPKEEATPVSVRGAEEKGFVPYFWNQECTTFSLGHRQKKKKDPSCSPSVRNTVERPV